MRQPALPADHLGQRALPVAVDTGHAQHLADAQRERYVLDAGLGAFAAGMCLRELERNLAAGGLRGAMLGAGDTQLGGLLGGREGLSEHQPHDLGLERRRASAARPVAVDGAGQAALAQHGDAVAERHRLVELVGDEDDREPVFAQAPEDALQLRHRLRGEHRRGLVKDQDARSAPERLDDLDLLLAAQRQVGARADGSMRTPSIELNSSRRAGPRRRRAAGRDCRRAGGSRAR